jgi:hypothetical protein
MSGKLFIFASTAIKFVLDTCHLDPEGQLNLLLTLQSTGESSLSDLDDLYSCILQSAKPSKHAEVWLGRFKKLVGAILVLQTPLPASILANLLDEADSALKAALGNLHSVLAPQSGVSGSIYKVHHKSFPDFIMGPSCPSEFQIKESEHHEDLAKHCLEVMNRQLKYNICQVPVPSEDQFKDLDDLLKKGLQIGHISEELQYAACYWANHLSRVQNMDSSCVDLLEAFSKEHLMHWLETLAYIKQLDIAHIALKKALDFLVSQGL